MKHLNWRVDTKYVNTRCRSMANEGIQKAFKTLEFKQTDEEGNKTLTALIQTW